MTSQAMKKEMMRLEAMARERAPKKAPKTPTRNAGGMWMMMVEREEPVSGRVNSSAAAMTRLPVVVVSVGCCLAWRRRAMCSDMTMASSMMSPTAAAIPPRVMMLKVWPRM